MSLGECLIFPGPCGWLGQDHLHEGGASSDRAHKKMLDIDDILPAGHPPDPASEFLEGGLVEANS
jgi:hypothetical protein